MPTITPPLPPAPPTITPAPVPVLTVILPPVELARLTIGGLLEASVQNQAGKETYLLQTAIGPVSVLSTVPLPKDAVLLLQILSLSPQALLQINSVNGAAPTAAFKAGLPTELASAPANASIAGGRPSGINPTAALPSLLAGTVIRAALVRPLTLPVAPLAAATVGSPGTHPSATPQTAPPAATSGLKPPTIAPGVPGAPSLTGSAGPLSRVPGPGTPVPGTAQTAGPTQGGIAARPVGSAPAFLPIGTQVSFKITNVQLPSPVANNIITPPSTAGTAALGAGKILTGVITGTTAAGHPVVQTEAGVFSLNAQSSAPRGSIVTLEVTTPPRSPSAVGAPPAHPGQNTSSIFADRRWPPLEEALQVLHDVSPAASRQLVSTVLPRPDVQLTSALVFFLSALRGGDLRSWFGESNMRILEKFRPNLASRLTSDFSMLGKVADEPVSADWRVAMIPVNTGAQIEQIRMLIRHHDENQETGAGDQGTRFILDVDLSRLGRIQLDGLVRDKGRKLDLIIRSGDVLTDESRNEIRRIYSEAAALTGLTGSVGFQASPPDYIDIADPLANKVAGLVV